MPFWHCCFTAAPDPRQPLRQPLRRRAVAGACLGDHPIGRTTRGIPEPIVHTTLIFMAIVAAFCVMQLFLRCLGVCSKDDTSIALVLYPLAGFCCWLLWLCTWMHQWHPLLCPIYEGEGSGKSAPPGICQNVVSS